MNPTDTPPLTFQPRKSPVRRRPAVEAPAAPPPPVPPVPPLLVAAAYDPGASVTLTFDRAVDVAGMDVAAVAVEDGAVMGFRYAGSGTPTVIDPVTVSVPLSGVEEFSGPGVTLGVAAGNGVVAAEGGAAWAGCDGVFCLLPSAFCLLPTAYCLLSKRQLRRRQKRITADWTSAVSFCISAYRLLPTAYFNEISAARSCTARSASAPGRGRCRPHARCARCPSP